MHRGLALCLLVFCSCSSRMTSWNEGRSQTDLALEEFRLELSDLKHSLDGTKVDLQLMDEKIRGQESSLKSQLTTKSQAKGAELSLQLANLEHKLTELQKNQEKLSAHANQTIATFTKQQDKIRDLEQEIQAQNRRLDEVVKLKGTLSSLSQVLKEKSREESTFFFIVSKIQNQIG